MENNQSIEDRLNQLAGSDHGTGEVEPEEYSPMADPAVSQHIIRSNVDGKDLFSGEFRVSIPAQQTISVLHVPLHPPMPIVPVVEAFCDNEAVRIRVTDAQRFGVRLEIKTTAIEAAVDEVVQVQITAG